MRHGVPRRGGRRFRLRRRALRAGERRRNRRRAARGAVGRCPPADPHQLRRRRRSRAGARAAGRTGGLEPGSVAPAVPHHQAPRRGAGSRAERRAGRGGQPVLRDRPRRLRPQRVRRSVQALLEGTHPVLLRGRRQLRRCPRRRPGHAPRGAARPGRPALPARRREPHPSRVPGRSRVGRGPPLPGVDHAVLARPVPWLGGTPLGQGQATVSRPGTAVRPVLLLPLRPRPARAGLSSPAPDPVVARRARFPVSVPAARYVMRPESAWQDRLVCVTGGTGFLGYHLVTQLLDAGARVRVFALPPRPNHPLLDESRVVLKTGDIRDPDAVRDAVRDCEVIFHAAGPVLSWGPGLAAMIEIHREGTRCVLEAADADATVVHTSSIVAVGASPEQAIPDEETSFDPDLLRVAYVRAKWEAEQVALRAGEEGRRVVVANPGYLFGPDDPERSVMGRVCLRFWTGRLMAHPSNGVNVVDVRDAARGHLLAASRGQPGRRYILGGVNLSYGELFRRLASTAAMRPRALVPLPSWVQHGLAYVAEWRAGQTSREPYPSHEGVSLNRLNWFASSERARRELGYEARPLEQTLRDAYGWYRHRRSLKLGRFQRWWMRPAA